MNTIGYDNILKTKWNTWKAKMYALARKGAGLGLKERDKVLRNFQDLNMPIVEKPSCIEQMKNGRHTESALQGENVEDGFVDMGGKCVRRTQLSWTGLYGKAPWPRERKVWEKV